MSFEKTNPSNTVKDDGWLTTETDNHSNLTRYFIIISALVFTFLMINITLTPDTTNIKCGEENDEKGGKVQHINLTNFTMTSDAPNDVCTSVDCIQAAARLSSYMDNKANPCEDFYQYSCGGWEKSHSIPSDQANWDIFGELAQKNYDYFLNLLSQEPTQNDTDALVKAKRMFVACNNTNQIVKDELQAMRYIINVTGGWDRTNVTQNGTWSINSNLPLEHYHRSAAFFSFAVQPDDYNASIADIEVNKNS